MTLRLVLFDVDGTLVDSQAHIVGSMEAGFRALGLAAPTRAQTLSIVGLSLPEAMVRLYPAGTAAQHDALVRAYKDAYMDLRSSAGEANQSPLYPGVTEVIEALRAQSDVILGVATGKSRRGLDHVLAAHDLEGVFFTQQVADNHPSKPHPSMIEAALYDSGVEAGAAVMIGDTSFDMQMARSAGVQALGVTWGYHTGDALGALTDHLVHTAQDIPTALNTIWEG